MFNSWVEYINFISTLNKQELKDHDKYKKELENKGKSKIDALKGAYAYSCEKRSINKLESQTANLAATAKLNTIPQKYVDIYLKDASKDHHQSMNEVVTEWAADNNLSWSSIEVNNFIHHMYADERFSTKDSVISVIL
jgi:hypothetical protein